VSRAESPSLDDGKNNSRTTEGGDIEQSTLFDPREDWCGDLDGEDCERYDCRDVYANFEHESGGGETAPFRCGSWRCFCCAHRMRMNLIEELDRLVEERPEMRRLLTLTLDPVQSPDRTEDQHEYLTERFNALRTELNDNYDGLSYIWIRHEGEENGRPHLHLLVDRYLPQDELSVMAGRVGLGEVVDIRRVNARNAAKYLTSYLGKGALAGLPKGLRRYGSSADIDLNVRGGGGGGGRDWTLMMDDFKPVAFGRAEPLRREVETVDFRLQRNWGGPKPPPL